jgi:hypothetical protein
VPTLLTAILLVGCNGLDNGSTGGGPSADRMGVSHGIVSGSISEIGGWEAWDDVSEVTAACNLAVYDEKARPYINRMQVTVDYDSLTMTAVAETPAGTWTGKVDAAENVTIYGQGFQGSGPDRERMKRALVLLSHRFRGPLNFVLTEERPHGRKAVRVDGQDVARVGVQGDVRHAIAYYFDETTAALRFITSGADKAGQDGTVTVYSWQMLDNSLAVPAEIRVMHIGDYVLIGNRPMLEAEFTDVTMK